MVKKLFIVLLVTVGAIAARLYGEILPVVEPADSLAMLHHHALPEANRRILHAIGAVGLTLLVVAAQVFFIWLLNRLLNRNLERFLTRHSARWFHGINVKNNQIIGVQQQIAALMWVAKIVRYALIIISLYLTLPIIFSIFPFTRSWADRLFGWIWTPFVGILKAIAAYLPKLVTLLVIWLFFRYTLKFARYLTDQIASGKIKIPGFYPDWSVATFHIVRVLLFAFMFVIMFPYLPGSDSDVFKGVSVFLGILVSFGSSSAVSNMIAGILITYMRPFRIGDRVRINGYTGDIVEKTSFVVRIRSTKNEIVTFPNTVILNSEIINYSTETLDDGVIFYTNVTISYDVPWRKVHELLIQAALKTPLIEATPSPYILQISLDDYYVTYQLCAYTKNANAQTTTYSNLHAAIQDVFNEAEIEIMSQGYLSIRDGARTTTPDQYLKPDYKTPPTLRVEEKSAPPEK